MRVRNKYTGIVCEKSEAELSVLPDMYVLVDDKTPLTRLSCCGGDDTIDNDNDTFLKEEDNG